MFSSLISRMIRLWLRTTGRSVQLREHAWLGGPQGGDGYIGEEFYSD